MIIMSAILIIAVIKYIFWPAFTITWNFIWRLVKIAIKAVLVVTALLLVISHIAALA